MAQSIRRTTLSQSSHTIFVVSAGLVAATAIAYAGCLQNGFVNYDDDRYVFANSHVQQGLSWAGIRWAFVSTDCANWHPVTWLSLELDTTLFGQKPWGYHFTNLLLHGTNSVLLFQVLSRMTGAAGRSAVVAAFFALHPLHVESVAWVAERKDVLCGLFFFLALLAWHRYVLRATWGRYAIVVLLLSLGLLAKPMLVTFPFLLLLLDVWPLARWRGALNQDGPCAAGQAWKQFLLEKLPLLVLVLASCAITYLVQRHGGAIRSTEQLPLVDRLINAPIACLAYLSKTFWLTRLAVYYPHPERAASLAEVITGAAILFAVSLLAIRFARRWPYLFVGWFWWLGMLVPVIGIVQVGSQAYADRYVYLPLVGLLIAIVWGAADCAADLRSFARLAAGLVCCLLVTCILLTYRQVRYWHDGVSLWLHAVEVTSPNPVAFNSLGVALSERGQQAEAIEWFSKGLEIAPDDERCHQNLALSLIALRHYDEALAQLEQVIRINPANALAQFNAGVLLERQGYPAAAIERYRRALAIEPDYWRAHLQLGRALAHNGALEEAERHVTEALRLNPELQSARRSPGDPAR